MTDVFEDSDCTLSGAVSLQTTDIGPTPTGRSRYAVGPWRNAASKSSRLTTPVAAAMFSRTMTSTGASAVSCSTLNLSRAATFSGNWSTPPTWWPRIIAQPGVRARVPTQAGHHSRFAQRLRIPWSLGQPARARAVRPGDHRHATPL